MLIATASGVFGEMQAALNTIWKTRSRETTLSRLIRARVTSLGLVAALGFLLVVSLVVSAGLTASANYLDRLPVGTLILSGVNFAVSWLLFALLFGAIYKVLPDRTLQWKDVIIGALMTSLLLHRESAHRLVYRQQRGRFELRRRRRSHRAAIAGVLLGSDFPVRGRVHENLREYARQQAQEAGRGLADYSGTGRISLSVARTKPIVPP